MNHLTVQLTELFHMDRSALNLAKSTIGIAIVLIALILFSTIGAFGFTMAFGAVLAIGLDGPGSRQRRATYLSIFALLGALATLLGNGAGQSEWMSVVVVFGVTLICGLALAFGLQATKMAFLINLWMMVSLSLSPVLFAPVSLALGFFCGIGLVAGVLLLTQTAAADASAADSGVAARPQERPPLAHFSWRSPIMQFALIRALAAAFAMWLGWQIAPGHPFWIAMTFVIVAVPDRQKIARTAWQRAIGTVIGVAISAAALSFDLPQITLLLLWLLVMLVMLAVQGVNYLLYVTVLTFNLILFYQLLEADVLFRGMERLVTTLLGIGLAMGMIVLLSYLAKTHTPLQADVS